MEFKDYYKIMGVARDATEAQIKTAYRKLARKYHPDVSKEKDAEARFKDLGEAYEVLKNPEKRAAYDQLGQGPRPGEQFRPPPDWGSGFEFSGGGDQDAAYSDFFESLFGRQARGRGRGRVRRRPQCGSPCAGAAGSGGEPAGRPARFYATRTRSINAEGHVESKERTLNVQIPKGIFAGQTIRLPGQGAPAAEHGPAGDLFIEVEFQPHRYYRVDGRDLILDAARRALGSEPRREHRDSDARRRKCSSRFRRARIRAASCGCAAAASRRRPPAIYTRCSRSRCRRRATTRRRRPICAMAAAMPFNPRANLESENS